MLICVQTPVPANERKEKNTLKDELSLCLRVNETARLTENFGVFFPFFFFFKNKKKLRQIFGEFETYWFTRGSETFPLNTRIFNQSDTCLQGIFHPVC